MNRSIKIQTQPGTMEQERHIHLMPELENLFCGLDRYDTPQNAHRALADRLLCNSRWYFYANNFNTFRMTGQCAKAGKLDQERQVFFSNRNVKLVERCGGKIHLRGLDHLRNLNGQPVILMGNHMSLLETALFHAIVRPYLDFTFVIKESLFRVPFFGDIMRALESIPVGRANPRDDFRIVMTQGKERLSRGKSIILFPQATRSERFIPENFNSIGIKVARAANVPIIPFVLKTDFIANGTLIRDLGPIRRDREIYFEFAAPERVNGNGRELHQKIVDFTIDRLSSWYRNENRTFMVEYPGAPAQP